MFNNVMKIIENCEDRTVNLDSAKKLSENFPNDFKQVILLIGHSKKTQEIVKMLGHEMLNPNLDIKNVMERYQKDNFKSISYVEPQEPIMNKLTRGMSKDQIEALVISTLKNCEKRNIKINENLKEMV